MSKEELGSDGLPGHDYFLDAVNHIDQAVKSNTIAIGAAKGDRKSTRLNSSHTDISRMPSSA